MCCVRGDMAGSGHRPRPSAFLMAEISGRSARLLTLIPSLSLQDGVRPDFFGVNGQRREKLLCIRRREEDMHAHFPIPRARAAPSMRNTPWHCNDFLGGGTGKCSLHPVPSRTGTVRLRPVSVPYTLMCKFLEQEERKTALPFLLRCRVRFPSLSCDIQV